MTKEERAAKRKAYLKAWRKAHPNYHKEWEKAHPRNQTARNLKYQRSEKGKAKRQITQWFYFHSEKQKITRAWYLERKLHG